MPTVHWLSCLQLVAAATYIIFREQAACFEFHLEHFAELAGVKAAGGTTRLWVEGRESFKDSAGVQHRLDCFVSHLSCFVTVDVFGVLEPWASGIGPALFRARGCLSSRQVWESFGQEEEMNDASLEANFSPVSEGVEPAHETQKTQKTKRWRLAGVEGEQSAEAMKVSTSCCWQRRL